jgi:hypothetical protein
LELNIHCFNLSLLFLENFHTAFSISPPAFFVILKYIPPIILQFLRLKDPSLYLGPQSHLIPLPPLKHSIEHSKDTEW